VSRWRAGSAALATRDDVRACSSSSSSSSSNCDEHQLASRSHDAGNSIASNGAVPPAMHLPLVGVSEAAGQLIPAFLHGVSVACYADALS